MVRADFGDELDVVHVFPDCWQAVQAFNCLSTQWRAGMAGPTGLDYAALPVVFRLLRIPRDEWPQLFEDIGVMEDAALSQMREEH